MSSERAITDLRRRFRRARRAIRPDAQRDHADTVARVVASSGVLLRASTFGAYFSQPADGELDTAPLLARLWSARKTVACPVIGPAAGMDLYQVKPSTPLVANRYGILEPRTHGRGASRYVQPLSLSALFLPLVAFDEQGSRIGMGAGFYDRYLGRLPPPFRPLLIGLAHEVQRSPEPLPRRPWDVPLDAVATEAGWRSCTARSRL